MSLLTELTDLVSRAFLSDGLDGAYGDVVVSQRPELAQFQCNGALSAAKPAGRSPREIADQVATKIAEDARIKDVSVAGPGFINIVLTDAAIAASAQDVIDAGDMGLPEIEPRAILVDYGGPNVAKPLHVGHLRPAIIGEAVKRLFRLQGHNVVGDVHLGDWGTPMGQLINEIRIRMPDLPYFDETFSDPYPQDSPVTVAELEEIYPAASQRCKDDPNEAENARRATLALQNGRPGYRALWQHFRTVSVAAIKENYDELGVEFDLWYGESDVNDLLAPLIERLVVNGYAEESNGSLIVRVQTEDDNREIPPLILAKSDGATLYSTWDLATIEDRIQTLGIVEIIYIVDLRQSLHFEQVFRVARLAGIAGDDVILEHAGNGTVNGSDGTPLKTRTGGVKTLRSLLDEATESAMSQMDDRGLAAGYPDEERLAIAHTVGLAAVKFGDLSNHRESNYTFDMNRFTSFDGKTGPYLLYGSVRMSSLLRRAGAEGVDAGGIVPPTYQAERTLLLVLARFPEVIARAASLRAPNHVAEYAYDVVAAYNRFYEQCHVLTEKDTDRRAGWVGLVAHSRATLGQLLHVLGIEVPERM
ncbi:MAG: arginine--tRNA ligase [Acidobacteria bacterium]|nr:arginine--tRNA ligase [Acidobacteriota bacterium]